ncbi:ras-associating and dilute domain-containing protein isoform X1 [Thalassophryne amazonica]|uniref:ras-associating and dilute domain-containing protein isoform X1 n=1 Tax=Thalassophryne amazonica TaxID=390379 RepID=UPI0014717065|nr:ras-associating and dilute domain-containing protein isoform X1 [Thalassophryne amazonica]
MFYGSSSGASMSLPSKSRLKRQSRTFTQVLYRTLSYRDRVPAEGGTMTRGGRRSATEPPECPVDDPAELSTQSSAPGVLKIFGDEICAGANYKSVLATPRSSAQELVKEALERYSLSKATAHSYVLCDVIGRLDGVGGMEGGGWRTECLRALGDNEKPLLLQELWKPREGHARRFELRRRAEVEELNAKDKDTITAGIKPPQFLAALMGRSGLGKHRNSPLRSVRVVQSGSKDINAQARKLQRNRAKGTLTLPRSSNSSFCRSLSETSLNQLEVGEESKRYYSTLPGPVRGREREVTSNGRRKEEGSHGGGVRHSLYQSPHLLLLQGYNKQDCLVYLLNREQHTVGQETSSARPNICLFSPDILPLHCRLRRVPAPRRHANNKGEDVADNQRFCVAVEPVLNATVLVNFSRCERSITLQHGDLLSFGAHYIFLYKDPTGAKPLPAQTLARLRTLGQLYDGGVEEGEGGAQVCKMCGSALKDRLPQVSSVAATRRCFKPHLVKPRSVGTTAVGHAGLTGVEGGGGRAGGGGAQKRRLQLEFDQAHEDQLLNRIMSLIEPGGDDHKLTPAYLLCLCIQHSASSFPPGSFGKLLLKIVRRIQTIAWEKTKELAQKQAQHQDPASLSLLSISDLVPDLQTIFFWMSNSIEILYFIQQRAPAYTHSIDTLQGSKESLLSATISANEEAMSILEEVIMYTFQQCVYYITKALYVVLPGLLDCNPFPVDNSEPCWKGVGFPEPIRRVLQVFQSAQELLQGYQVHTEIQAQMFAYLFFFSNVSLFNQLMDKGPSHGWFQRSKVLQIQACLRMVMEWANRSGLGHLADKFFTKLNSTVSVLATPSQQLTQLSWRAISSKHTTLKPVQLHRILTQYQLTAEIGPVAAWQPSSEDEAYIYRTVDLLESFENHPPIVLPSAGFRVDLDSECVEDSIYRQLLYIRHFLWGLRTKMQTHCSAPAVHTHSNGTNTADWPEVQRELLAPVHSSPRTGSTGDEVTADTCEERVRDRSSGQLHCNLRRNGATHHPRTANPDPSCLLTPPNTPLYPEGGGGPGSIIGSNTQTNGCSGRTVAECKKANGLIANGLEGKMRTE